MEKTFEINGIVYAVTVCTATAACDNEPREALRVIATMESGETMMHNVFGWDMPETAEDFMDMCEDASAWEVIELEGKTMTKTMRTPRGTFEVELFRTEREITEAGFGLYFTTDDGRDLYTRSNCETWHTDFAAVCTVCGELIRADAPDAGCPECAGELEQVGMLDYFEDALDVEYCIGGSGREYRSVCVMVTCGGPNVFVDTETRQVELYWGTDREDFGLSQSVIAAIDDAFEELYNC